MNKKNKKNEITFYNIIKRENYEIFKTLIIHDTNLDIKNIEKFRINQFF